MAWALTGTMPLSVKLHALDGATPAQAAFVAEAVALLEEAVSDPRFLGAVVGADYIDTHWSDAQGGTRVFTVAQIATRLGEGRERGTAADQVIDLAFTLADLPGAEGPPRVLGSTALGTLPISTARWSVDRCMAANEGAGDPVNLASHFLHEWCHVSGFFHYPDNKARGDTSYVAGRLVRETLAERHGARVDSAITALMADRETDCGCRGNAG